MRSILIWVFLVLLVCGAVSCKKFLSTDPQDFSAPEQFYNTEEQLHQALGGIYQSLATQGVYGIDLSLYLMASTDELFYRSTDPKPNSMAYDHTSADVFVDRSWKELFGGINQANYLLANINRPEMDENKRNVIRGEALFLRAYFYFLLVSYWGEVPLLLEPTVDGRKVNNPGTSLKDIYDRIVKDMMEAKDLVNSYTVNGNPVHISRTAIQGILARVCLKMAGHPLNDVSKYAEARAWADSVIQSGIHKLNTSYSQIFINESADLYDEAYKETLWEVEFFGNNIGPLKMASAFVPYIAVINTDPQAGRGYAKAAVTGTLYKKFDPADLRRDWTIAPYSFLNGKGTIEVLKDPADMYSRQVGKWRRKYEVVKPSHTETSPANFPVIRYSDVLLMFAEAENAINGPTSAAYDAINQVRRRGFGFPASQEKASVDVVTGIRLSSTGNTGYLKTVTSVPVTISGGGGSGATAVATAGNGKIAFINILTPGTGYTSEPTITIGAMWAANTFYPKDTQVVYGNNLYTVTAAGSSTDIPPMQTSGASDAAITGAVFSYAGEKANATATIGTSLVDLPPGLDKTAFQNAIMDERARELCFEGCRKFDLIRWGKFIEIMKLVGADQQTNAPSNLKYSARAYNNVSDKHNLFPIPSLELSLNNAIKQNPGW